MYNIVYRCKKFSNKPHLDSPNILFISQGPCGLQADAMAAAAEAAKSEEQKRAEAEAEAKAEGEADSCAISCVSP